MIALLLQFGPWILSALAGVAALLMHWNAKAKVAAAGQKVAEAQTSAAQAQTQTAEVRDAEAQANAAAAQVAADSAKERTDVENHIAADPPGESARVLRDNWSRD
jgi:hypothetical protein